MDERDQMTQEKPEEEVKTTPELSAETSAEESVMTMETDLPTLEEGAIIQAKVVLVQDDAAYVDVGWKSDLPVPLPELTAEKVTSAHQVVKEGDYIEVKVVRSRDEDKVLLSKRQAEQSRLWQELEEVYKEKQQVTGEIKKAIKGGLEVEIKGLRAFLPASQADLGFVRDLNTLVGQESNFYIIEFSIPKRQLVVSRRAVLEEEKAAAEERIYSQIKEGDTRTGVVTRLASFGAFVDIGEGVEGLLHVSELSWDHVGHPSERLKEGDQIEALIIKIDAEAKRISLSLKQLIPHPWETAAEKFKAGDIVEGEVVRITPFGAFVHLGEGIDGLIHISQLSEERVEKPEDVVAVGQKVKARILKVDPENRRIGLSLREPKAKKEPELEKTEPKGASKEETPLLYQEDNKPLASNLGDLLAEKMSAANNHNEKED
ncbi:MAG TPA: 30S ribosomal protein S1 [Firmicutes bacterium]|nr:30S ribosomal protein S1 [Bacillota bacterium]